MKTAFATLFIITLTAAAETQPTARIARFSGDRAAAISYTFDDNLRDQCTLAVPMLNEVGFKGTFFVVAGKTAETPEEGEKKQHSPKASGMWGGISWPELKVMADNGHEISSHTWSHRGMKQMPPAEVEAELKSAWDAINTRIGRPPLTLAFPFNQSTPEVQAAALKHHAAFRSFQFGTSEKTTVQSLNAWADKLIKEKKWGVFMAHGIAKGYAALTDPEILRAHLKHVKERESEIWVDTFASVARYEMERDDAKLTVIGKLGEMTCTLSGTLDPQRYDVPLTVVIDVKVTSARAVRSGKELPTRIENGSIHVEAKPDTLPITVTWK